MTWMRSLCVFLLICGNGFNLSAQSFEKAKPYYILKYDVSAEVADYSRAIIKSPFAKDVLSKKPLPKDLNQGKIVAIDYYYTQFKSAESFQQIGLDKARFKNLKAQFPQVYQLVDSVPVRFIEQTLAQTVKEAKFFFHGFVIYYQLPTKGLNPRRAEINRIKKLFKNNFKLDDSPEYGQIRQIKGTQQGDFLHVWGETIHLSRPDTVIEADINDVERAVKLATDGEFVTCYKEGKLLGKNKVEVGLYRVPKKNFPGTSPPPFSEGMFGIKEKAYKESRLRALSMQKQVFPNEVSGNLHKSLQDYKEDSIVVVIDVTGSMVNAIAQVLKWMHQDDVQSRIKGVAFFNDGDGKKDKRKVVGSTGGIYFVDDFKSLQKILIKSMSKGGGGDLHENDMEAVIEARKHFGKGNYILVADNNAYPRDLALVHNIKFPVDLLICNAQETMYYYLDIVKQTGGKVINKK